MHNRITRRRFSAGIVATGAAVAGRGAALGVLGANERVRLGIIGVGNRGDQLVDAFKQQPDAQFAAICDVYDPYVAFAKEKVGGGPFVTRDYRRLLERKDVDAVVIATPDHWHALQFIEACQAGKDVYVEKPLSLVISEGRRMVEAARRYERVTQVGLHRRSSPICRRAVELVRSGAIGKVTTARCYHLTNESPMGMGKAVDCEPPADLDWDLWLGPAPKVAYNPNRCHYKFRWFRQYSGGQMTNFGTHYLDMIHWATGQDVPLGVFAGGGRYVLDDGREIPDTLEGVWEYPGLLVTFSQINANAAAGNLRDSEIEFRGTEGTLYCGGNKIELIPESPRVEPLPARSPLRRKADSKQGSAVRKAREPLVETGGVEDADHARNFLDGVKSRKPCSCDIETGHRSTTATLLANVSLDRKRYLAWDGQREQVTNDPDANKLLSYEYRAPWKVL